MTAARKRTSPPAAPLQLADVGEDAPQHEIFHLDKLASRLVVILAQATHAQLAAIEGAAVAITGAAPMSAPEALPPAGVAIMDLLMERAPYRGTTLDEMASAIYSATGKAWSEASIRRHLLPSLREEWGVKSKPRIGYYLPDHRRLFHIRHHSHALDAA